jgi:hypothetical protein
MIVLFFYLFFVIAPIGSILHELGHGLGALLLKAERVEIFIGIGKRIIDVTGKRLLVSLHLFFFLGGYSISQRERQYTRTEKAIICISGPALNLLVAGIASFAASFFSKNGMVDLFVYFNVWLGLINLIPFKIGRKHSDGYKICSLLKNSH